jgi:hypothetical protein
MPCLNSLKRSENGPIHRDCIHARDGIKEKVAEFDATSEVHDISDISSHTG